ncbi:MAG: ABC transporter permease [Candidatus Heimdallarchaeota archaeon]|nr:ABC transporter permease [Candidatus Heimdallarchaeota archaeon]
MSKPSQKGENKWQKYSIVIPFLIGAILWEILAFFTILDPILFPPPSQLFFTFFNLLLNRRPSLIDHIIRSLYHIFMGYSLGVIIGISIGILMGLNRFIYNTLNPILALLIPVPTLAWVPLLLIILGLGDITIITAIFLGCFFPIVYNTLNGIRGTDKQLIWAARTMGSNRIDILLEVLFPSALLSILTGLRLSIGYAWRALVGAEMLAGITMGIGHMIYAARWGFNLDVMFTGLIIISLGGLIMDRVLIIPLEKATVLRWGLLEEKGGKQ